MGQRERVRSILTKLGLSEAIDLVKRIKFVVFAFT